MNAAPVVVFRCDSTRDTGFGHLSRCLALAEGFADAGIGSVFVGHFDETPRMLLNNAGIANFILRSPSWSNHDLVEFARVAKETGAIGAVIDSYVVGSDYIAEAERVVAPTLVVDDFAALPEYRCSAVLNFTSRAELFNYNVSNGVLFLGPRWLLARRGLRQLRAKQVPLRPYARTALITTGANDPADLVIASLECLLACDPTLSVRLVTGPAFDQHGRAAELLSRFTGSTNVASTLPGLAAEFEQADLMLSSAGLTKYEAAYLGIPAGVFSQNEGQALDAVVFEQLGLCAHLAEGNAIDVAAIADRVKRLTRDRKFRNQLRENCYAVFPPDPTLALVEILRSEVFRYR